MMNISYGKQNRLIKVAFKLSIKLQQNSGNKKELLSMNKRPQS